MAKSLTLTVNDAGDAEQIVAQTVCRSVTFGEDEGVAGWPTVNWEFRRATDDNWISKLAGTKQMFTRPDGGNWQPTNVVADVRVKSGDGSSTFAQHEE